MLFKKLSIILLLFLFVIGCSTKKNTFVSRNYHNLTAHYNVYFNGNESFKAGAKKVEANNKDNYTELLTVFPSSKKENLDVATSEMDYAIQKGGKLITKHSITAKPSSSSYAHKHKNQKEFNNWVDDAYLLVAKSQFYKKEYNECISTCNTILRDYSETPAKYDAVIWMGRALIETKQYADAQTVLDGYDVSAGAPRVLLPFYMATMADLNIRQEKLNDAIPYMKAAAESVRKKSLRIRYNFILAQLYHQTGNTAEASMAYEKVIKMNPSYEIAFNAKVKRSSILLAGASSDEIKKQLYKLLKNKKNIDFQDRIYYGLGKVSLSENNDEEALINFKKSVALSKENGSQKAVSFIELGNLYYKKEQYKLAFLDYDSAMTIMDKESKEYNALIEKHASLKNMVEQMDIVHFEDSVQLIAKLSPKDQEAYVSKMIAGKKKALADKEQAKQDALQNNASSEFDNPSSENGGATLGAGSGAGASGKWYFYNPSFVTQGKSEFERKWGARKLEDNWRRQNKESVLSEPSMDNGPSDLDTNVAAKDKKGEKQDSTKTAAEPRKRAASVESDKILTPEEYLKDIPNTKDEIALSNKNIETALYQISRVSANELHDYPNAIKTLDELLRRFPNSISVSEYLMSEYQIFMANKDQAGMDRVKARILHDYPNDEFTQYLSDPDYLKKFEQHKRENDSIYQISYQAYINNDFDKCLSVSNGAQIANPKNLLADKFSFLIALCHAKTGDSDKFKSGLTSLVETYPTSECTPLAKSFLSEIEKGKTPIKVANLAPKEKPLLGNEQAAQTPEALEVQYVYPDSTAYMVVVIANGICDKNRLNYNVADYNFERFIISDYELTSQALKDKYLLKIEPFGSATEAMDYFFAIREHQTLFNVDNSGEVQIIVISKGNLARLVTSGTLESYLKFFNRNFLKRND